MNTLRSHCPNRSPASSFRRACRPILLGLAMVAAVQQASAQLTFNLVPAAGMDIQAINGFQAAGNRWSAQFNDNVQVNINIGFTALAAGVLGQASSAQVGVSFANTKTFMGLDATTADDFTAVANLQPGANMSLLMNGTTEVGGNPNSYFVDTTGANTSTIRMTRANAKALGLLAGNSAVVDANITFSNQFLWDFDPTDGIMAGAFDFIGVATHEIGHAMGFISGVDVLDNNMIGGGNPFTFGSDQFTFVSPLDLFRYSGDSIAAGSSDWTADNRAKHFSIDGGATLGPLFSNGIYHGDGRQASHWKDSLYIGILDPTAARGELLGITHNDVRAFDVIGWNAVPDNGSTAALLGLGLLVLAVRRRKS